VIARVFIVLAALALILGVPFALKPKTNAFTDADDSIVILSPHNEAIRHEFTRGFAAFYKKTTGRTVQIDWRQVGGTADIARYLKSEYTTAFRNAWEAQGKRWDATCARAFDNAKVELGATPQDDTPEQAVRRAFLASNAGIGVDLFFGGGAYDFIQQAAAGRLVDSGLVAQYAEVFTDRSFPQMVSGEPFYDKQGRWIGACVSSFGICYNSDSLGRLGFDELPAGWTDLTDPRLIRQVALADPTKSGSAAKAYEMIIQQQMQEVMAEFQRTRVGQDAAVIEREAVAEGWLRGLRILQRSGANARYFTDAASQVPIDVSMGDAAAGMCIDFYGRFQSESVRLTDGTSRLRYFTPVGGSSVGADPIALLRGAPNRDVATRFMAYVISIEGQKLWNFRPGTPGGPQRYALRRLPIRKELYQPEYARYRSDPAVNPYTEAASFVYRPQWTAPLFHVLRLIVRSACIEPHEELVAAWSALHPHGGDAANAAAWAAFSDLSAVDYPTAMESLRPALASGDPLAEVRLISELSGKFREQYRRSVQLLREEKP